MSQQLDSFDEFIESNIQELVWEDSHLILDQPAQHTSEDQYENKRFEITFGKIYISKPTQTEGDGTTHPMFPQEARLRNLTYSSPLYVDMSKKKFLSDDRVRKGNELEWVEEKVDGEEAQLKVFLGKVPIMLRSKFCMLRDLGEHEFYELKECPYDMGGYFVINGSEKVLIAQERSAANIVQVFKKLHLRQFPTWPRSGLRLKRVRV